MPLRRDVALKVIAADLIGENDQQRQDHLRRFRHEAHALADCWRLSPPSWR